MNLALVSDLAATGFGRVGREFARRFIDAGHELRIVGINYRGKQGEVAAALGSGASPEAVADLIRKIDADPVLTRALPANVMGDGMGHNLTRGLVDGTLSPNWKPDVLLVVADPRAMQERLMTDRGACAMVPTFNYVPIEGQGLTPFWRRIWEIVRPVAMSDFGAEQVGRLTGKPVPVVRHGVSPDFYRVSAARPGHAKERDVHSKAEAKAVLGWTDRTVILRTDRNVPRKNYAAFFEALPPILDAYPEVLVVVHCSVIDEGGILGEHLAHLPGAYDNGAGWRHSQVLFTRAHDTYVGLADAQLNVLYNAADIYASTSLAEGFGLTMLEALACGVPVVTTDFGPSVETVGPGGLLVEPARMLGNVYAHKWADVDVPQFSAALERLVADRGLRESLGAAGEIHSRTFDWDAEAGRFLELMTTAVA